MIVNPQEADVFFCYSLRSETETRPVITEDRINEEQTGKKKEDRVCVQTFTIKIPVFILKWGPMATCGVRCLGL